MSANENFYFAVKLDDDLYVTVETFGKKEKYSISGNISDALFLKWAPTGERLNEIAYALAVERNRLTGVEITITEGLPCDPREL